MFPALLNCHNWPHNLRDLNPIDYTFWGTLQQLMYRQKFNKKSRAVARKLHDAAAVLIGLKFADDIHYKFKGSQASKARLQGRHFRKFLGKS